MEACTAGLDAAANTPGISLSPMGDPAQEDEDVVAHIYGENFGEYNDLNKKVIDRITDDSYDVMKDDAKDGDAPKKN